MQNIPEMWALYRTARVVGGVCLFLTAYLCLAFYNFEGDVERLRARHMTYVMRPELKPLVYTKGLKPADIAGQKNGVVKDIESQQSPPAVARRQPVLPGNLSAPHLLHLRVEYIVKSSLLSSIVFENLHDPYEADHVLRDYESKLIKARGKQADHMDANKWKLAESWVQPQHGIVPHRVPGNLGEVLRELSTADILTADIATKGTQLKLLLTLRGGQQALFKPMFYPRTHIIRDGPFAGSDRHNGEIVAFHLAGLLGMHRTPIVAGRRISLDEIRGKSTPALNTTFYKEGNRSCFYGKCYYCKRANGVCGDDSGQLEGAVVLLLPPKFRLQPHRSPWQRTYKNGVYARWETDMSYCKRVRFIPEFSGRRILDLMDNAIVDFLIGNADRHHVETFQGVKDSPILLLDNGKSFGNPYEDDFSILAPLYQCCLLRNQTYHRLAMFVGKLGAGLERMTREDPLYPLLTQDHFDAIDRRLKLVLGTLLYCKKYSNLTIVEK
ncbi:glycosaminoglycan xylosylkinase-like isoform X2 [Varroa destructor]|uniref:FAM20 C-terminal domain-containing protein n=1 Tax=Varroa destructor TaxID=109461 RepID=A0A7M7J6W6_VARDE|nr:glycosaminoglycan xylosylkinase-like isoform X2 [Varroa destructor]